MSSLLRHLGLNRRATAPPSPLDAVTVVYRVLAVARAQRWRARWKEKVQEIRGNEPILWQQCGLSLDFVLAGYICYVSIFRPSQSPLFLQAAHNGFDQGRNGFSNRHQFLLIE
ncbi:MAG: hypothetical protein OXE94_14900 [Aestuariivita sp.]|nr:hypothetical protein [Aestuariivita sp.]